jgi:hypothetical protein
MKQQITERLQTLQAERDAGQKMLAELDARRGSLTTTLLRIEGAIQVLTEIAGDAETAGPNVSSPDDESADR